MLIANKYDTMKMVLYIQRLIWVSWLLDKCEKRDFSNGKSLIYDFHIHSAGPRMEKSAMSNVCKIGCPNCSLGLWVFKK